MSRGRLSLAALLLPLLLAGCSLAPGSSGASSPPATPAVPTVAAPPHVADTSDSPGQAGAATATAPPAAAPPNTAGTTATVAATATGAAHPSATPRPTPRATPSATPRPTLSATPSPTPRPTSTATVAPTPVILAPIHLAEAEVGGGKLYPHYWTNAHALAFSMAAAPGTTPAMRPEVEVEPLARTYTGAPTAQGRPLPADRPGTVLVQVDTLPEGPYHWRARLSDGNGHHGPWVDYYQGPAFRLLRTPPPAPLISSSTHPDQHATYSAFMARLTWAMPPHKWPIQGYRIGIDRRPNGLPDSRLTSATATVLGPLASGDLYFHVRAEDWAGNLGQVATYTLHIDHRAPLLAHAAFDRFQFNPQFDALTMHFIPNKAVRVRAEIRRQATRGLVRVLDGGQVAAGARATVRWDGRDARGVPVQPGLYTMVVYATDRLGNVGDGYYADLGVNYRRIVIHLASQSMQIYDGATLLRSTLVTTGNQHLPTPPGLWHVVARFHPYKFLSPWKKGSAYWYPTTSVDYALNFHAGGYFIHDASWRSVFGPGTNSSPGAPGSGIYAGSHGCVEVPGDVMGWLYGWATIGTVVQVVP